uniref:Uncharacterized protein n=1 Tax=viral metagenome TaxID=1070528 RepID=A0A6C0JMV7_9ZZZZ
MAYTRKQRQRQKIKRVHLTDYKGGAKSTLDFRDKNNMGIVKKAIRQIKDIFEDIVIEIHNKNKPVGIAATIVRNINEMYIPAITLHNDDEMKDLVRKLTQAHSYLLNTSINLNLEHVNISSKLQKRIDDTKDLIKPKNVAFSLVNNPNTELDEHLNQNANRFFTEVNAAKNASAEIRRVELNRRESQTRAMINTNGRRRSTHKKSKSHSKSSRSKSSNRFSKSE